MKISDEMLSGFLDAELPEEQMEAVRTALIEDESIAERLAEMAEVDQLVKETYSRIDKQPLPAALLQRLQAPVDTPKGQILPFPRVFKRWQPQALAAGIVLALGFGIGLSLRSTDSGDWNAVVAVLETSPSGFEQAVDGGAVKPRITFVNQDGNYCRQFLHRFEDRSAEEAIACRSDGTWQVVARSDRHGAADSGAYRTASGPEVLEQSLDAMISGAPFDAAAEQQVINNHWVK